MRATVVAESWMPDGRRVIRYARGFDNAMEALAHAEEIKPKWVDPNVHVDVIIETEEGD